MLSTYIVFLSILRCFKICFALINGRCFSYVYRNIIPGLGARLIGYGDMKYLLWNYEKASE